MFDILKQFESLYPQYDSAYYDSIVFRFAKVGGDKGREEENLRKGKFFSNVYELYIYVTVLGLTVDKPIPLKKGAEQLLMEMGNKTGIGPEIIIGGLVSELSSVSYDFRGIAIHVYPH